jgi:hypothetical protein
VATMTKWATFHGSVSDEGEIYKLTATGENGVFTLPKEFVLFEHGKISVKVGAAAKLIQEPSGSGDIVGFEPKEECGRTCSIGLVEICCEDGRVVGACRMRISG